jgi:uncharacterized protein YbjT (DUF2867 family)
MRIHVSGAGGFVGSHVEAEACRRGHEVTGPTREADAVIHLSPVRVRAALDEAWARGAHGFVLLSTLGASPAAEEATRAAAGHGEELVRASGLRWAALRPDLLWGPGDVFTNEIAHLPFVPVPRGGVKLAPVHVLDVATALLWLVESDEAWGGAWSLRGPESLRYGAVVERVALAMFGSGRRRVSVPAWSVRMAAALEERAARRPRLSRELVDWRVAVELSPKAPPLPGADPRRAMTVDALREYLDGERRPEEQVGA